MRRALDVVLDPELDEPITDLGFVRSVDDRRGRRRGGAPAPAHVVLLAELRLPDGVRRARTPSTALAGRRPGGRRARRPPRLRPHQPRAGRRRRATAAPSGTRPRGPRGAAGDVPAQGAHRGDGAVADGAAARRDREPRARTTSATVRLADLPAGHDHRGAAAAAGRRSVWPTTPDVARARRPRGPGYAADDVPLRLRLARSHPHLHRRQRALLPRSAPHPLPRARRPTRPTGPTARPAAGSTGRSSPSPPLKEPQP